MKTLLCEHLEDVLFLFYEGVGFRKIGKLYHASGEGVRQLLIRRGIDTSDKNSRGTYNSVQKVTMYDKKQILKLYKEGIPNREIAEKFNICLTSVIISLRQFGVEDVCSYHSKQNFERAKKFVELFLEGESLNSIGKQFNCFPAQVKHSIVKELGKKRYNKIMSKRNCGGRR